jgi:hypothetical protein
MTQKKKKAKFRISLRKIHKMMKMKNKTLMRLMRKTNFKKLNNGKSQTSIITMGQMESYGLIYKEIARKTIRCLRVPR